MEKFDGYRAVWWPSGHEKSPCFLTRNGAPFKPPPSWNGLLPHDMRLDGEIWAGRVAMVAVVFYALEESITKAPLFP